VPEGLTNSEFREYLLSQMPKTIKDIRLVKDNLVIYTGAENISDLLNFLKGDSTSKFSQLITLTAVDYPERKKRFEIVYCLLSLVYNRRVIVKISTDEETPVESIVPIYSAAGWYEREVWDLYGVKFANHADLRRILTDYGFEGHPMRKDFPLTGYLEVRYDEEEKKVVYEKVNLNQEFRSFDYLSPWEGAKYAFENEEAK